MKNKMRKKGQEEMVGFALIIIVVAVILLFFLSMSFSNKENVKESREIESFIQSSLSYTTNCTLNEENKEYLQIREIIFECINDQTCSDDRKTCEVLKKELKNMLSAGWNIDYKGVNKGYEFEIYENDDLLLKLGEGNATSTSKGSVQDFAKSDDSIKIFFTVYS